MGLSPPLWFSVLSSRCLQIEFSRWHWTFAENINLSINSQQSLFSAGLKSFDTYYLIILGGCPTLLCIRTNIINTTWLVVTCKVWSKKTTVNQKYAFIKKSTIFSKSIRNSVKIRQVRMSNLFWPSFIMIG